MTVSVASGPGVSQISRGSSGDSSGTEGPARSQTQQHPRLISIFGGISTSRSTLYSASSAASPSSPYLASDMASHIPRHLPSMVVPPSSYSIHKAPQYSHLYGAASSSQYNHGPSLGSPLFHAPIQSMSISQQPSLHQHSLHHQAEALSNGAGTAVDLDLLSSSAHSISSELSHRPASSTEMHRQHSNDEQAYPITPHFSHHLEQHQQQHQLRHYHSEDSNLHERIRNSPSPIDESADYQASYGMAANGGYEDGEASEATTMPSSAASRTTFIHPNGSHQRGSEDDDSIMENASPKRIFIAPTSFASSSAGSGAPSAVPSIASSTGTYSTYEPPTPGSAPAHMMQFPSQAKLHQQQQHYFDTGSANGGTTDVGGGPDYAHPPPTAPLPFRSNSYDENAHGSYHPHPPATAHPGSSTAFRYEQSSTSASFDGHPASYPGASNDFHPPTPTSAAQVAPSLPRPGVMIPPISASSSSTFSPHIGTSSIGASYGSPFETMRSPHIPPASPFPEHGYVLAPLRSLPPPSSHLADAWEHAHAAATHASHHPAHVSHVHSYHNRPSPITSSFGRSNDDHHHLPTSPTSPMFESSHKLEEKVKTIEASSGATSFISKLWFLLSHPEEFGEYIRWTAKGTGFILSHNSPTFGESILSRFFRHSNIASFIRQLNLYKMVRMSQLALLEDLNDSGGRVDGELTHTGFSHPHLQRDKAELLHLIKPQSGRKRPSRKDLRESVTLNDTQPALPSSPKKTRSASLMKAL